MSFVNINVLTNNTFITQFKLYIYYIYITFRLMHLAEAFIQSDFKLQFLNNI